MSDTFEAYRVAAPPIIVGDVTFLAWKIAKDRYERRSVDSRIVVTLDPLGTAYNCKVDGLPIVGAGGKPRRFKRQITAMVTGIHHATGRPPLVIIPKEVKITRKRKGVHR